MSESRKCKKRGRNYLRRSDSAEKQEEWGEGWPLAGNLLEAGKCKRDGTKYTKKLLHGRGKSGK